MTVAAYVTNETDASTLISWGVRFARADHTDLLVITTKRSKGKTGWEDVRVTDSEENPLRASIFKAVASQNQENVVLKQDISAGVESSDMDRVAIEIREFHAPAPEQAIVEEIRNQIKITLLLLPVKQPARQAGVSTSLVRDLFDHSPCEACMIRGPAPDEAQPIRILLATHGGSDIETELTRSRQLAQTAGLGLVRNSGAVVIGAMLVAPLMTPLVGIGFALLQGNSRLVRSAMRSVVLGFAVAFVIGVFVGLIAPAEMIMPAGRYNSELLGRCEPNWIDLVIALVSGIAGAYATGRPNLLSALPGVAIAAALVPPLATSGIMFAVMEFNLSIGALLLFFVNIVAIVLGTTVAFWGIGISSVIRGNDDRKPDQWPRYWFFAFVIIAFLLAILLPMRNSHLDKHRNSQNGVESGGDVSN